MNVYYQCWNTLRWLCLLKKKPNLNISNLSGHIVDQTKRKKSATMYLLYAATLKIKIPPVL